MVLDLNFAEMNSFFKQSSDQKMRVAKLKSKYFNGYNGPRSTNISPGESVDIKESVCFGHVSKG